MRRVRASLMSIALSYFHKSPYDSLLVVLNSLPQKIMEQLSIVVIFIWEEKKRKPNVFLFTLLKSKKP